MYLALLHSSHALGRLIYIYCTKKTEGNGQELEEWGCITNCDVGGCVT